MEYFYSDRIDESRILLNEEESRHCLKVMRHRVGDEIFITDGKGSLFRTRIMSNDPKEVLAEILEIVKQQTANFPEVHIVIAPPKNIDRFEWFLEKATEVGVAVITPIKCSRSERNTLKDDRLKKIILSAMKQSLRVYLPRLNPMVRFSEFIRQMASNQQEQSQRFICHCQWQNLPALKSLYKAGGNVCILIGPEGDFTIDEVNAAESNSFYGVNLGSARLRTETAGLVALQTVHLIND